MTTCSIYSEIKMRLPWVVGIVFSQINLYGPFLTAVRPWPGFNRTDRITEWPGL